MRIFRPRGGVAATAKSAGAIALFALFALCCGSGGDAPPAAGPREDLSADAEADETTARDEREADDETPDWSHPRSAERQKERDRMSSVIRLHGLRDEKVLAAMAAVPRHEFVSDRYAGQAYADRPLPIGHGQTISQPYMVAEMTRQLQLKRDSRVLEIGTGSGYQAAVLSEFTPHVYTIEIIKELAESAAGRFEKLGYKTVKTRRGDGYYGWEKQAPFDAIIVTAAAGRIPPPLLKQLAPGGRMVIPVGGPFSAQVLVLVQKAEDGAITSRELMGVRFVPFVHKEE